MSTKDFFPPAIPNKLLESQDPRDAEIVRIGNLANQLYSDYSEGTPDPYQLLACIIRNLTPDYFYKVSFSRETAAKLLDAPGMADRIKQLYRFVGTSDLSPILKSQVCGSALTYLRDVCQASAGELGHLKRSFDVEAFWEEFWAAE